MKAIKGLITALLLSAPLFANAYTEWNDVIDFNPNPKLQMWESFSYTHDISDNGFNVGSDTVQGYTFTVGIRDDKDKWYEFSEIVYINQPGPIWSDSGAIELFNWVYEDITTGASYQGIAALNATGQLDITITSLLGDFYVDKSSLNAWGSSASVPEPSSLALLAAGLFGIAAMRRSAARNNA